MSPKTKGHSKQRDLLLQYLTHTKEHPTASAIARDMARLYGPLSTSNLYRNLDILVASGEVRRVKLDEGPDRFDANLVPHYHVQCTQCHRVWDRPIGEDDRCELSLPEGFQPEFWEILVRGRCARCAPSPHPFRSRR
jgi:Fe2+ or Zn2+ uptake regulation protein